PAQDSAHLNLHGYQQQHCRHRWASAIYSVDLEKLPSAPLVRRVHHFPAHLVFQMLLRQQLSLLAAADCALRPAARATAPDKKQPLPASEPRWQNYLWPPWPRRSRQKLPHMLSAPGALSQLPAAPRVSAADRNLPEQSRDHPGWRCRRGECQHQNGCNRPPHNQSPPCLQPALHRCYAPRSCNSRCSRPAAATTPQRPTHEQSSSSPLQHSFPAAATVSYTDTRPWRRSAQPMLQYGPARRGKS